jgi:hypothetical protein
MNHSPSPSIQGAPARVPRVNSSAAMSIASINSQEPRTGGLSPLSITYDDDFRYRTVSGL